VLRLLILGLVGGAAFTVAMNVAVSQAGATVTAFVAGLYAVIAALLAIPLLGERIERTTLLALVAALAGTVLLSDISRSRGSPGGVATALVAAIAFGTYLVLSRRWTGPYRLDGPLVGTTTMAISSVVTLSAAALVGDPLIPAEPSVNALVAMAWLSVGPGAAAAVLVVAGVKRLEARYASLFLLLNPPTAALLAVLLLHERLEPLQVLGAACVLLAIAGASGVWRQAKGRPT
jgi:drug/metabolite transporter (DMT)-like permease